MERNIHVAELLNLLLLIQRNSENICHTNLHIFINKETAPVGTAVWAGAFDRQPAGYKSVCIRKVLQQPNSTNVCHRFPLYYSKS